MKKSVILVLALILVAAFAVGCASDEEVVTTATQAPEVTIEATVEATAAAPITAATVEAEATDNSTVTEEDTEETTPDETSAS